ncbi:tripartite tricarboxylate transporter TctB family protein [Roseomonas haemaphysalidis]|uniref:Tripartite tricarboxylate transporter TctB family protein n=1 Tax=Roseomonas haemaphysalidis TaxID=2768162 RepID=A0ABS3KKE3_9PROT|nr:tripartite tricarboxylate transporter TctB family protein [Roseomonas haemaphysalidis]MBO1077935.1 tripartite tricarboxylate transporter TctB family protein [Roseomonas haemaphysalidis]
MLNRHQLELIFAAIVFVIGAIGLYGSLDLTVGWAEDGPQAGYFPFRVGLILMVASLLVAMQAWRGRAALRQVPVADGPGARRVLGFALPVVALVAVSQWLGLYVGMALYLLGVIRFQGRRPWHVALGVALGVTVATFLVFEKWFLVPLLKGPLEVMLGLG